MPIITSSLAHLLLVALSAAAAPTNHTLPRRAPGSSNVVGSCGVSAQHMFVGTNDKVYLLDRSDSNPLKLANGDPATAAEWSLSENQCRAMQVESNQFCAGGGVLSDGTWANVGGNPAQNGNFQTDGLRAIRHMKPCDDDSCQWAESTDLQLQVPRWYPSVETMDDGSVIIFGGYDKQVFLPFPKDGNAASAEYFPSKGKPQDVPVLDRAWPFSMYPLTSHLSDGRIFMVAGSETAIWDPTDATEVQLPKMPNGPRTYPGGGASVLLPLTPDNDYEETFMACGGTILADWGDAACPPDNAYKTPAHAKCDMIKPLAKNPQWTSAADLPSRRVMGNFIILPTGELMLVNGAENGVQGYVCGPGESQAINPALVPQLYNPKTNKWSEMAATTVPRGYHSSATLLPDGSVMTAGSSPHADVSTAGPFPTEFRLEVIRPAYVDAQRPDNKQLPISYPTGGQPFTMEFTDEAAAQSAVVRLIRTGWSTHGLQMGQRSLELQRTVNGKAVTFQQPRDAKLFPPGSALAFVVVNNIPSVGKMSTVGTGQAPQGMAA